MTGRQGPLSLVITHNLLAAEAARNLSGIYSQLAVSTQRLSSGLRIVSAKDDPAGLALREFLRSDIAVLHQGLRNASDAMSMIQTAEGALAVIDEKLIRMRELAEQAATGTYTTAQREIMNSEYQQMATEIDRLANDTDFNGIKLLDGSTAYEHQGQGIKIHFGTGNDPAEDYYFLRTGDVRATEKTGLKVGGDGDNDIWALGGVGACCGLGEFVSLTGSVAGISGTTFSFSYNYDQNPEFDPNGAGSGGIWGHFSYLAGLYFGSSGDSLEDLVTEINQGAQSRIKISLTGDVSASTWGLGEPTSGAVNLCLGNEVYQFISGATASAVDTAKDLFKALDTHVQAGSALVQAINQSSLSFWAYKDGADVYVFHRSWGDFDHLTGADAGLGSAGISAADAYVNWQNMETYSVYASSARFGQGGEDWAEATAVQTATGSWGFRLEGRDVGDGFDLRVFNVGSGTSFDLDIADMGFTAGTQTFSSLWASKFVELQDAADPEWIGAEIRTQSSAQEALDAVLSAILKKDEVAGDLGAIHSRLENTVTSLTFQADALSEAESRISDVDVALEITEFTKNLVLAQVSTAMLAQANSMPQMVLALLN